jgi:hypothetical protein
VQNPPVIFIIELGNECFVVYFPSVIGMILIEMSAPRIGRVRISNFGYRPHINPNPGIGSHNSQYSETYAPGVSMVLDSICHPNRLKRPHSWLRANTPCL